MNTAKTPHTGRGLRDHIHRTNIETPSRHVGVVARRRKQRGWHNVAAWSSVLLLGLSAAVMLFLGGNFAVEGTEAVQNEPQEDTHSSPMVLEAMRLDLKRAKSQERLQTIWPSDDNSGKPNEYMKRFVTGSKTQRMFECRTIYDDGLWGWFDSVEGGVAKIGKRAYPVGPGSECRVGDKVTYTYTQCDQAADPIYLLCDGAGEVNVDLFAKGGSADQGCETTDYVADYVMGNKKLISRLKESGLCRRK